MKYFTQKLYYGINSCNKLIAEKAYKEWENNLKSYKAFLDKRASELPPKLSYFIWNISLHDGLVLTSSYGSYINIKDQWHRKRKRYFRIQVLHYKGQYLYTLEFTQIRKCETNYTPGKSLYDEWAYDEISITKDKWVRFEMWMFSGSTILIEFKNFNYYRSKFKN